MKHYSSALIASVSVVAMLVSGPVLSRELEEIIVTAQKRSENQQRVPLAISAFTQEYLNKIGANNIERLDALTPGLEWGQFGHSAKISIRGLSLVNTESNADSSVAFHVDGVYLGRGMQAWTSMTDVERVEVARGPQGTLFGRNATGGTVNIINKKPSQEFAAKFELTAGDYNHIGTSGHLNFPMSDNWAARVSFVTENHDGYLININDRDNDQLDEDMWSVRGALRYDNGPLVVDFSVEYYDQSGDGNGFSGAKFFDQSNLALNTFACVLPGSPDMGFIPEGCPDLPGNLETDWEIDANRSYRDTENLLVTGKLSYDFGEMNFKSITAYSDFFQLAGGETDFTPQWLLDCRLDTDATVFTQEFQLSSTGADKLEWLVGAYYLDEKIDESFILVLPFGAPLGEDPEPTAAAIDEFRGFDRVGTIKTTSLAAFGQATYHFNDQLGLTLGARYTEDDRDYVSTEKAGMAARCEIDISHKFSEPTWKVGLDYLIDDSRMVYATVSTGYRSGSFNRCRPPDPPIPGGIDFELVIPAETITNYEIGFKGDLADNTLRANVTAFYNKIDDYQGYAFDDTNTSSVIASAAAKTKGAELELTWLPSEPVQINFILAYLDAYFTDYQAFNNGAVQIDASGNKRELSPEWKGTIAVSYDIDLGSMGTLTPYVQSTYKDDYFVTAANNILEQDREGSYTQTDIRLIWSSLDRHWRGELYLTNIEDNFVKTGAFLATGGYWLTYGPEPRVFGGKLSYTY